MLLSIILLVSCVGSSAHDSAQPHEVVRDVPAPNTGGGSDGPFAKSKLQLRYFFYDFIYLAMVRTRCCKVELSPACNSRSLKRGCSCGSFYASFSRTTSAKQDYNIILRETI